MCANKCIFIHIYIYIYIYIHAYVGTYMNVCVYVVSARAYVCASVLSLVSLICYAYVKQREMVDFGKSDRMRKISGRVDKPNTDNGFSNDISLYAHTHTHTHTLTHSHM